MFSFLKGNNSIVWGFGLVLHVKGVESAAVFLWHGETMTHWLQNCVQGCVCVIDPIDLLGAFFYFLSCSGRKIYPMVEKNLPVMFKQSNKSSFSPSKCPFKLPGWEFDAKVFYNYNSKMISLDEFFGWKAARLVISLSNVWPIPKGHRKGNLWPETELLMTHGKEEVDERNKLLISNSVRSWP